MIIIYYYKKVFFMYDLVCLVAQNNTLHKYMYTSCSAHIQTTNDIKDFKMNIKLWLVNIKL